MDGNGGRNVKFSEVRSQNALLSDVSDYKILKHFIFE